MEARRRDRSCSVLGRVRLHNISCHRAVFSAALATFAGLLEPCLERAIRRPRVGRDLLVGCLAGTLMGILVLAPEVLALNLPRQVPWTPYSARQAVPLRDCIAYRVCGVVPPSGQKRQRTARRHRYGNGMACGRIHQDGQRIDGLYCFRNAVASHDGVRGRHTQDRAWRSRNSLVPECGRSPFRGR